MARNQRRHLRGLRLQQLLHGLAELIGRGGLG
jgi:hypothetical protein